MHQDWEHKGSNSHSRIDSAQVLHGTRKASYGHISRVPWLDPFVVSFWFAVPPLLIYRKIHFAWFMYMQRFGCCFHAGMQLFVGICLVRMRLFMYRFMRLSWFTVGPFLFLSSLDYFSPVCQDTFVFVFAPCVCVCAHGTSIEVMNNERYTSITIDMRDIVS